MDEISVASTPPPEIQYHKKISGIVEYVRHQTRLRRVETIHEHLNTSSHSGHVVSDSHDPASDIVMGSLTDMLSWNKVEGETNPVDTDVPPHGKAWARVRTNVAPPQDCKQGFFVPYLGEADEDLDASSRLAHDLLEENVDTDKKAAVEFFDQTPFAACVKDSVKEQADDSDAEGELYEWNKDRSSEDYVHGTWDRAFKREAVFTTAKFFGPEKFSGILKPLSRILKISEEAVSRYFSNALYRTWKWLKFDEHERVKRQHNLQILQWIAKEERTPTAAILESNSVDYFFCRHCKIHDCSLHGVGAESKPKIVPYDSTRKDSMSEQDQRKIEQECPFSGTPKCWYYHSILEMNAIAASVANGVKEIDITKTGENEKLANGAGSYQAFSNGTNRDVIVIDSSSDESIAAQRGNVFREDSGAKGLLMLNRRVFGDDFCRIADMINSLEIVSVTCADVGAYIREELKCEGKSTASIRPKKKPFKRPKNLITWKETALMKKGLRMDYSPCNHAGPCTASNCSCKRNGLYCEKFCNCYSPRINGNRMHEADWCTNTFRGCSCRTGCGTKSCDCNGAGRECDPDYCKCLSHIDVEANGSKSKVQCRNVSLRMQNTARIVCGHSSVHGWGVYASGLVRKGDLIGQYTGEVIEQQDGERRGRVYDQMKSSFLFNTTAEYVVDSTRLGNKLRYINHSKNHNCSSRLMRVDGDVIVGIYASRDIMSFEELLFDYGYGKDGPEFARGQSGEGSHSKKRKLIAPAKRKQSKLPIDRDTKTNNNSQDVNSADDDGSNREFVRRETKSDARRTRASNSGTTSALPRGKSKPSGSAGGGPSGSVSPNREHTRKKSLGIASKRSSSPTAAVSSKRVRSSDDNENKSLQSTPLPGAAKPTFAQGVQKSINANPCFTDDTHQIGSTNKSQPTCEKADSTLRENNAPEQDVPMSASDPQAQESGTEALAPSQEESIEVIDLISPAALSPASLSSLDDGIAASEDAQHNS